MVQYHASKAERNRSRTVSTSASTQQHMTRIYSFILCLFITQSIAQDNTTSLKSKAKFPIGSSMRFVPFMKDTILQALQERAAAHGDINLITLLMGAHGRGLQVLNRKGDWIDAIAGENELMVNVGDMLSRHTNNVLKSTIHRVANPPKEMWGSSRYSIPFFMHPIATMPLNVLPHCINDQQPKQYDDITAGGFLTERLIDLGLLKA
jgi:isopenicillin N synthase-like dioxygenase